MMEAPKVYCHKEEKEVPIWQCLGSYVQRVTSCPELIEAFVDIKDDFAKVKCKAQPRSLLQKIWDWFMFREEM